MKKEEEKNEDLRKDEVLIGLYGEGGVLLGNQ